MDSPAVSPPIWRVGIGIRALADSERHLGHAVRKGHFWLAWDAVHSNASNSGFKQLGRFKTVGDAQRAIESSVGVPGGWWTPVAGQSKATLYLM
jgi:hypothetical protein